MRSSTAIAASKDSGMAVKAIERGAHVAQKQVQNGQYENRRNQPANL